MKGRPGAGEYGEYYGRYIAQVPGEEILPEMERQKEEVARLLRSVPSEKETHRYADGKWSIREVVGHVIDAERVFSYRALAFSRGDGNALPGFDENDWMKGAAFDARPLPDLTAELDHLREANLRLLRGLTPDAWLRSGVASGASMSVRALAWVMAGHMRHHMRVLQERYLSG